MGNYQFKELASVLLSQAMEFLPNWLDGGKKIGNEFVCSGLRGGQGKSLSINLVSGVWCDFATGDKGSDLISLYAAIMKLTQGKAYELLAKDTGHHLPLPEPTGEPNMVHYKHGKPTEVYPYRDTKGAIQFYVARYDLAEGKQFCPFSFIDGKWVKKSYPGKRTLYGAELLSQCPGAQVIVVEGERTAHAARKLFPKCVVLTWAGGSNAVSKSDFSVLAGRKIILWPDADEAGIKAMNCVFGALPDSLRENCRVLNVSGMPKAWDAADALSEGWDSEKAVAWAKERVASPTPPSDAQNVILPSFPDENEKGKRFGTLANVRELLRRIEAKARYNVITKQEEITIPGINPSMDNHDNVMFVHIKDWCIRCHIPFENLMGHLTTLCDENRYNPVAEWIESEKWDGKSRLQNFYETVHAPKTQIKDLLMRRWLISAVAAVYEPYGVDAHGMLVFQGLQYAGKTKWFKSLCPLKVLTDGFILRLDNKDSIYQAMTNWVVELGELDATFNRSDIAQLKAFIPKTEDVIRRPYAAKESRFARRTVFFGSVNEKEFLYDPSGNRRFWTIECESINYNHKVNMQQVWAEVYDLYRKEESWRLSAEENALLSESNESFEVTEPIEEMIISDFDWSDTRRDSYTVTEICKKIGIINPTRKDLLIAGRALRQCSTYKRSNGIKLYELAPQRIKPTGYVALPQSGKNPKNQGTKEIH